MLPIVSLCTPTYNRRPFISIMLKCIENQTYPKEFIEWIIVDDGTDNVEDLVKEVPYIKYYKTEKMPLGQKRNLMHKYTKGDIIIYIDDDDYYPPDRIKEAVVSLLRNPTHLIAGSSIMHVYFNDIIGRTEQSRKEQSRGEQNLVAESMTPLTPWALR